MSTDAHDQREWETGNWDFDPATDPAWDDPKIKRRRIPVGEYPELADAIVRGASIAYCIIEDLRALIETVQAHPDALLHRIGEPNKDGFVRSSRAFDRHGNWHFGHATLLKLHGCLIESCAASKLEITCSLSIQSRFYGKAEFKEARFGGITGFGRARFGRIAEFHEAHFCKTVGFGLARFDWEAKFTNSRFIDYAGFHDARFAGDAGFNGACFAGEVWFSGARFEAKAEFDKACFTSITEFSRARFGEDARFYRTRFDGFTHFASAGFVAAAEFGGSLFACDAWFYGARIGGRANFGDSRFNGLARFEGAVFGNHVFFRKARFKEAWFNDARFGGKAQFDDARFGGKAQFDDVRFGGDINFVGVHVRHHAELDLRNIRVEQRISFASTDGQRGAVVFGLLSLNGATIDERVILRGTVFGKHARFDCRRCLARGGATIELGMEELGPNRLRNTLARLGRTGLGRPRGQIKSQLTRSLAILSRWFGLLRSPALIKGDDDRKPTDLRRAAENYELLAANFSMQPATDTEEDECRWRAHELRRLALFYELVGQTKDACRRAVLPSRMDTNSTRYRDWFFEYFGLMFSIFLIKQAFSLLMVLVLFLLSMIKVAYSWFIERLCIGYLLQTKRIVVSAIGVFLGSATIYWLWATPDTIAYNGVLQSGETAMDAWHSSVFSPLYFSLTTFVTLGYGDFAPLGWFKLVTGLEALLGVALLALFTVAWGRKLVR